MSLYVCASNLLPSSSLPSSSNGAVHCAMCIYDFVLENIVELRAIRPSVRPSLQNCPIVHEPAKSIWLLQLLPYPSVRPSVRPFISFFFVLFCLSRATSVTASSSSKSHWPSTLDASSRTGSWHFFLSIHVRPRPSILFGHQWTL